MAESPQERLIAYGFAALMVALPLIIWPGFADRVLQKNVIFFLAVSLMLIGWSALGNRRLVVNSQAWLILVFLGLVAVSTWFSVQRELSLWGLHGYWEAAPTFLVLATTYFLALQVKWDSRRTLTLLYAAVAGAAMVSVLVLFNFSGELVVAGRVIPADRTRPILASTNSLSFYLTMIYAIALRLLLRPKSPKIEKAALAAATILIFAANAVTFSRTGWMLSVAITVGAVLLSARKKSILAAMAILALAAIVAMGLTARQESLKTYAGQRFLSIFDSASSLPRTSMWRAAVKLALDRPLTGYGPDTFSTVITRYEALSLAAGTAWPNGNRPRSPHNYFLNIGAGLGLPALAILLIIFGRAVYAAFAGDYLKRTLGLSMISALFAGSMFVWLPFLMMPFWLFMGIVAPTSRVNERRAGAGIRVALAVLGVLLVAWAGRLVAADHYYKLGRAAGNNRAKEAYFAKAVKVNPYVEEYWRFLFKNAGERSNRQAIGVAQEAQKFLPLAEKPIINEAALKWESGAEADEVLKVIERALSLRPHSMEAHLLKGQVLLKSQNYEAAEKEFDLVIAVSYSPPWRKYFWEARAGKIKMEELKHQSEVGPRPRL